MNGRRSAIYRGEVAHARHAPRKHRFAYSVFQMYLDLDELPTLFDGAWLWSFERWNVASFRRKHYLGGADAPRDAGIDDLKAAVRARVEAATGVAPPEGPIGLLTNLGYLGFCFNPVSFYYLFELDGRTLHAIVAEITNTPWNERFQYVLPASKARADGEYLEWRFDKDFHVSPFFDMDHRYRWRFTTPGHTAASGLAVAMENLVGGDDGTRIFDANLSLVRHEVSPSSLRGSLLRHPWMTGKVLGAIYWQALRLWIKRVPFFSHPGMV
ncbi:hypothetical protein Poly30_35820 [Planctomycetes bacterium Poly30]|uniref:Chromosome partitioning protein ParA n=1 Tax=Saltatorellus ferox TaxID=2528018 RepID=A0A518EVB6_9BACT|nr:hypothetical protein Poly30_35820 [Planctomycetes bacterium Poly30]